MSEFIVSKVLDVLPDTLTPSTLYFVRTGLGFDVYLTDKHTPAAAARLNDTVIDTEGHIERWWDDSGAKQKLEGIDENANNYQHPTYNEASSGLYKVTVDSTGHVVAVSPVLGTDLPNIAASQVASGVLDVNRIPVMDAGKIGSGILDSDRIPGLDARKIVEGTLPADRVPDISADKISTGVLDEERIPGIPAHKIVSGTVSIDRLPAGALERLVHVADEAERFSLTVSIVQNGDTVLQEDTAVMYRVVNDQSLSSAAGYKEYVAGRAAAVDWSGVENKPNSLAGYGINDAVPTDDPRLTDSREWDAPRTTQEEMASGSVTEPRQMSPFDIRSAVYVHSGTTDSHGPYGLSFNQETNVYELLGASKRTQIQEQMRRCVLRKNGTVNYYLNEFDSTKKEDGSPAILSGLDGQVMVEIPAFYEKRSLQGNLHTWMVSLDPLPGYTLHPAFLRNGEDEVPRAYYRAYEGINLNGTLMSVSGVTPTRNTTRENFRAFARANGTGWSIAHWEILDAIRLMFITEYGTLNSQAVLGSGNDTGNDHGMLTGGSNVIGNHSSGPLHNNTWMSYRGIENLYGDCWEIVDGIGINNYRVYLSNDERTFADGVYDGAYTDTGIILPPASGSFVKYFTNNFLPQTLGGTSETYLTDGFWSAGGERVTYHGGNASSGRICGAFALNVSNALAHASVSVGAGLSFR